MKTSAKPPLTEFEQEFRSLCLKAAQIYADEGVRVRPFVRESLPVFNALPEEVRARALDAIRTDVEIMESIRDEGASLRDNPTHLWRFLKKFGLVPESDIFGKMTETDVIEVYFADQSGQRQMFRNLRFMECVSFSIEQLYGMDWRISSTRDPAAQDAIVQAAFAIMSGQVQATLELQIPTHEVQEIDSTELFTLAIKMKYLSPIRQNGRPVGAIVINHTDVIGKKT